MSKNLPLFLQKLKAANDYLKLPERPSPAERISVLRSYLQAAFTTSEAELADSYSPKFKADFQDSSLRCLKHITKTHEDFINVNSTEVRPIRVGTVSILVGGPLWFRLLLEKLLPALAFDNAIFLIPARSEDSPQALGPSTSQLEAVCKLLNEKGVPEGALQVLPFDIELHEFIYQHPGIKAHFLYLPAQHPDQSRLASFLSLDVFRTKKIQCFLGGKSVAAVLPGADLKQAAEKICAGIIEGAGLTPWNISRIVVVESLEKEFVKELKSALEQAPKVNPHEWGDKLAQAVKEICKTQGRNLSPITQAALLENISNCDESHQKELGLPIAALTAIKYPHEVNKWLGSLSNLVNLYCFGDPAKVKAVAQKSEAANIYFYSGLAQIDQPLLHGIKESVWGQPTKPGFPDSLFHWPQQQPLF